MRPADIASLGIANQRETTVVSLVSEWVALGAAHAAGLAVG
ncbi:hypothetical protein [uncultured Nocardioides sp.]|nr:hypothetical protein [uncultured Nocardioides sp.]